MKVLGLAAALIFATLLLMMYAQHWSLDASNTNRVPHPEGTMLAVNFAHADHVDQSCITCHHNYVDDTGIGMCFDCHKTDPEVAHLIEDQFHNLCRTCHLEEQANGNNHGPTRHCIACHVPDEHP